MTFLYFAIALLALIAIALGAILYVGMREDRRAREQWDYPQNFSMEGRNANRAEKPTERAGSDSREGVARRTVARVEQGTRSDSDIAADTPDERARAAGL